MGTPRKRFGQHFLRDQHFLDLIILAIAPKVGQHLVEIGPGQGALTLPLLEKVHELDAIELDKDLIRPLQLKCEPHGTLILHSQDVLKVDFAALRRDQRKLRVVGNLPYNISTPLLFHLLTYADIIEDMHFMLQKEVADRIAAPVNSEHYGRLSVMMQYACQAELLFDVPASAFFPPPKVESTIIRLVPHATLPYIAKDYPLFANIVRDAFGQRRKTLRNSLKKLVSDEDWSHISVDSHLRAEALSIKDFVEISHCLVNKGK